MGYRVEVFDRNLKRIGEIDEWISLDFTVRLAQEGAWQLLIKSGTRQSDLIQKGGGIVIWQDGVDTPVLSGPVDTFQKYWTKLQHTGPGSLYIAGKCHNTLAYRRLAFPDPSKAVTSQYQGDRWQRLVSPLKPMERVIWEELYNSLGPGALSDRRVSGINWGEEPDGFVLPWPKASDYLRMDGIGSKIEDWFTSKGVAYRFIYNPDTQQIDFKVFRPRDLSKTVRFSPDLGNLREYIWTLTAPKLTRAIVGAAGEKRERYYYQKVDADTESEWGMSIEQFVDRADIQLKVDTSTGEPVKSDSAMTADDVADAKDAIEDAASTALSDGAGNGNFQIYPIDTSECAFGKHYFVGDKVTVAVDGTEYVDVVREVVISVDDAGNTQDVAPKIGQQGSGEPLNLYKTVSEMQKKLRRLQARM
ncbi:siphovirus ReqiPepy6 Gp37-like family protein [Streptomyces sp. NPDC048281]|uniref:siphovirus ReqiPepy6 Gp37-like family protein n=1 Tax=Streptomyces sp. NPDC048281 TaxID=3154715 RepID=UPI0034330F66